MEHVDHVVIGAGAMGAATAWQLAKRGRNVVLVEQFGPAHKNGSSHGKVRIFRFSYRDPLYADLAMTALPLWRELEDESGARLLDQNGQLDHGLQTAIDDVQAALDRFKRPYELLAPQEANERWPGLHFEENVIYSPDGGRCYADDSVLALARRTEELGGTVIFNEKVHKVSVDGDFAIVESEHHTWRTPSVVVAAGAWVQKLLGDVVTLPSFMIDMGQPVHFQPKSELTNEELWPSFIHHAAEKRYDTNLAFSAYGMFTPGEGVKLGIWANTPPVDADTRTFDINPELLATAQEYARTWLPGVDVNTAEAVTCLFTNTQDEHFVMDRVGPITVCSPCSGHGYKFVPAIGKLTADLAMGGTQTVEQWKLPKN
jgi:sarcosine oxidase